MEAVVLSLRSQTKHLPDIKSVLNLKAEMEQNFFILGTGCNKCVCWLLVVAESHRCVLLALQA